MSQIIEINNSMQQKLNSIDHLLQSVENEDAPSLRMAQSPDASHISGLANNALKRARSGENERRHQELVDKNSNDTRSQNVSKIRS